MSNLHQLYGMDVLETAACPPVILQGAALDSKAPAVLMYCCCKPTSTAVLEA